MESVPDNESIQTAIDAAAEELFFHLRQIEATQLTVMKKPFQSVISKHSTFFNEAFNYLTLDEKLETITLFSKKNKRLLNCKDRQSRHWTVSPPVMFQIEDDDVLKINFSVYFRSCDEIAAKTVEKLADLPESVAKDKRELVLDHLLELYIFRLVAETAKATGKTDDFIPMLNTIKTLTKNLGDMATTSSYSLPDARKTQSPLDNPLIKNVTDVFKNIVSQVQPDSQASSSSSKPNPTSNNVSDMLATFFGDEQKAKLGKIFNELITTPPNDLASKFNQIYNDKDIQNMVKSVMDPNVTSQVSSMFINALNPSAASTAPAAQGDVQYEEDVKSAPVQEMPDLLQ